MFLTTNPTPLLPHLYPRHIIHQLLRSTLQPQRRTFFASSQLQVHTSELTPLQLLSLQANHSRLWSTIHHTCQWGALPQYGPHPTQTGMSRLSLSKSDKQARQWFADTTSSLSCTLHTDGIGNQFAIRPGMHNSALPTFIGSHLDTQPRGGRFDGILGVCAGIEALRVLEENWIETQAPVGVVNWTNEEGARFKRSMMGSGVWADQPGFGLEEVYALSEADGGGRTVMSELERIGALGTTPSHWQSGVRMAGHFELHIEQGPHLVENEQSIGVVQGAQGYKWFTLTIQGRDSHTGTTSFPYRADALYEAAKIITQVRSIGEEHGGLASVGIMHAEPGSVNTVPGTVSMSLDLRHHSDENLAAMHAAVQEYTTSLERESTTYGKGVQISMKQDFHSPPVKFHPDAIKCVEDAAHDLIQEDKKVRKMTSGAGHDSVFTSKRCPTAMVFVPCRDGISHAPEEWCEEDDCARGASVLMQAVVRFDRMRQQRGEFDGYSR